MLGNSRIAHDGTLEEEDAGVDQQPIMPLSPRSQVLMNQFTNTFEIMLNNQVLIRLDGLENHLGGFEDRLDQIDPWQNGQPQETANEGGDGEFVAENDVNLARGQRCLAHNRQGMGGHAGHANHLQEARRDDPLRKIKFSILKFDGKYNPEAYLDWELQVEQKFNCHHYPEDRWVRAATSEFVDYASIWWSQVHQRNRVPHTWNELKRLMRARFVPAYFERDLPYKMQRLNQGNKSVEDYYQELQVSMICASVHEGDNEKMVRFFGRAQQRNPRHTWIS
jgi:hypothetical protein